MKQWPKRYSFSLTLFIFGIVWAILMIVANSNSSEWGPGSSSALFYGIPLAVIGYIVGLIIDISKRK
ncbi:MAG: hypothetical protein Q8P52_03565 [bacterium]|nr:hypothetical protein [bacterium]